VAPKITSTVGKLEDGVGDGIRTVFMVARLAADGQ
jgi:hypothetical protein